MSRPPPDFVARARRAMRLRERIRVARAEAADESLEAWRNGGGDEKTTDQEDDRWRTRK